jgi:hypothetical protein
MKTIKHVGKLKNTGVKVIVIFRTLPGESQNALVLPTAQLPDVYHDAIMSLVESDQGQDSNEFGEIMFSRRFPDGRVMLTAMQQDNRLQKFSTNLIEMTPTLSSTIPLDELNLMIAQQKNVAVDDLCMLVSGYKEKSESNEPLIQSTKESLAESENHVLDDKDLAKSYRSQADAMYKEAAKLRRQADELDPPQKKAASKTEQILDA